MPRGTDIEYLKRKAEELKPARNRAHQILDEEPDLIPTRLRARLQEENFKVTLEQTANWVRVHHARKRKTPSKERQPRRVIPMPQLANPIDFVRLHPESAMDVGLLMLSAIMVRDDEQQKRIKQLEEQVMQFEEQKQEGEAGWKNLMHQYNECQAQLKKLSGTWEIDPETHQLIPKRK